MKQYKNGKILNSDPIIISDGNSYYESKSASHQGSGFGVTFCNFNKYEHFNLLSNCFSYAKSSFIFYSAGKWPILFG